MSRKARCAAAVVPLVLALVGASVPAGHADEGPSVMDPRLAVRPVATGLVTPIGMAFLGPDDLLVLEKNTGRVRRVWGGVISGTVLDLAVNAASERGLLGVALHPDFPADPGVYLYWTESTTGADTTVLAETSLLGNRVDRFVWDGSTLTFDRTVIRLRALQDDATNGVSRGNHNGGVLRFGPDRKLYVYIGDVGRRGQMQNLPDGPGCATPPCPAIPQGNQPDDRFGGPEPDDAHLTGVILRLEPDGSTPADNPFVAAGAERGGAAGANLAKVFAYGVRNGFGMAFDPESGALWEAQNGDDSFTELNRVEAGANLGWAQVMGPIDRVAEFRSIETDATTVDPVTGGRYAGLQQARWAPTNIASSPEEARARLFTVTEGGTRFTADLTGAQEVPAVDTPATGRATFALNPDGTLDYELRAADVQDATQAHIHLGAPGQNGPVVAFLFGFVPGGIDVADEQVVATGTLDDDDVIARGGFDGTVAQLVQRLRQGRAYVNLHTVAAPGGEVRGPIRATDARAVSHYSDPEFAWRYEVAPAAVGFLDSRALGPQYQGDLFVGAARPSLVGGNLFRFDLTGNRRKVAVADARLEDRVADNHHKYDLTESESVLFGRDFGIVTDIATSPTGTLHLVSLTHGTIYEIHRR